MGFAMGVPMRTLPSLSVVLFLAGGCGPPRPLPSDAPPSSPAPWPAAVPRSPRDTGAPPDGVRFVFSASRDRAPRCNEPPVSARCRDAPPARIVLPEAWRFVR